MNCFALQSRALVLFAVTAGSAMSVSQITKEFDFTQLHTFAFKTDRPVMTRLIRIRLRPEDPECTSCATGGEWFTQATGNPDFYRRVLLAHKTEDTSAEHGGFGPGFGPAFGSRFGFGRGFGWGYGSPGAGVALRLWPGYLDH